MAKSKENPMAPAETRFGVAPQIFESKAAKITQPPSNEKPKCPTSPKHKSVRIYKWAGQIRYWVCDNCGTNWKEVKDE